MPTRRLTSRQHDVLKRLAAGETISRSDSALVVTVYALRNRRLVETPKAPGGHWVAQLTDDGRVAAETGRVPVSLPRPAGRASRVPPELPPPAEPETPMAPKARTKKPTRTPSIRKTITTATRAGLKGRVDEKGLLHSSGDASVRVSVSRPQISRAIRLIDTLLKAAESRGMTLRLNAHTDRGYGTQQQRVVEICHQGHPVTFRIIEESDRTSHTPTPAELAAQKRSSWARIPDWDYTPSGRLRIELPSGQQRDGVSARSRFADGPARRAEDKVDEVLDEIAARGEHALALREAALRLDMKYADERAKAVDVARVHYLEDLRAAAATEQANRWQQVELLRGYVAAMRDRAGNSADDEWLTWIEHHADTLDPPGSCAGPTSTARFRHRLGAPPLLERLAVRPSLAVG